MSTKVLQPASRYVPPIPRITNMVASHWLVAPIRPWIKNTRFKGMFRPIFTTKFAEHSSGLTGNIKQIKVDVENRSLAQIKADFYRVVEGIDRGVFGVPSAQRSDIERLVELLESQNPTPDPTLNLQKVGGYWKLVYSTITILGSKRTKLGLRDFIMLGDLFQYIDVAKGKAVNVIKFIVRGLKLNGQLTIEASFRVASNSRVDITYDSSSIIPDQLMNMFRKNYDLLLGIFNPDGWLEITYVDDNLRIGRDDNGNIFVLERSEETQT
ncbi:hypothetical protein K2173_005135 [Erythroxylum novogranatense]|uniref:Plastid lipid-associated protein/fibrillin conserved domain-containing protein n=1 Tax=Erythroxylum novogranatense TaxID=1862640 RepID=A0AAV8TRK1_9ROSI|nr:hypothetical protein K2173_005135 [Erythroxylum novogranatense]